MNRVHAQLPHVGKKKLDGPAPLNQLRSGPTIDLRSSPDLSINDLDREQLGSLSAALGLGEIGPTQDEMSDRCKEVRKLLSFSAEAWHCLKLRLPVREWLKNSQLRMGMGWGNFGSTELATVQERMAELIAITHCSFQEYRSSDDGSLELKLYFGGTDTLRDLVQDVQTLSGGVGPVMAAARELAGLFADVMSNSEGDCFISRIAGISMGGGVAQAFAAALQSKMQPDSARSPPALVVFDPVLVNDAQARHATKGGDIGYAYDELRGVAITVDYVENPRRGVMNLMKGVGRYKSPGLVQLRLGLKKGDAGRVLRIPPQTEEFLKAPVEHPDPTSTRIIPASRAAPSTPRPRLVLGYHASNSLDQAALGRFLRAT